MQRIELKGDAFSGKIEIPKGPYTVALQSDLQRISLLGGGKDYPLAAMKRRSSGKSRVTTVSFYCAGGRLWSLVISSPEFGEWLATIEYKK